MQSLLDRLLPTDDAPACHCSVSVDDRTVAVDARDCEGALADALACRETVAAAAAGTDASRLRVRTRGVDRFYGEATLDLLAAAGRFADLAREAAPGLAERAPREPQVVARDAAARAAPVDDIAAETGLLAAADAADEPFRPSIAPSIGDAHVATAPPESGQLRVASELSTGATARIYDVPGRGADAYHVRPVETTFEEAALRPLADAAESLAEQGDGRSPVRAVRAACGDDVPEAVSNRTLAALLEKHTRGFGVLEDLFADPAVTDVYASGPAAETPLWVVADGEQLRTNVTLSADGVAAIASKLRRESGQAFSRASPTLDAAARIAGERVRVAGVLEPATEGRAFAFRSAGDDAFTLPGLIANGTVTPGAAGLLSVAVRRSAAGLVAGTRGAGKTTLLGALLWELPATTRTIVVEDTPELPVETLQHRGRDVQPLHATLEQGPGVTPTEALRTALRLGESALVLGEVRGEEAAVLYEAMRVGASAETVLGTIHGDGGDAVRERVVGDLGVPASSFAVTDLVVTCEHRESDPDDRTGDRDDLAGGGSTSGGSPAEPDEPGTDVLSSRGPNQPSSRRVSAIEELRGDGAGFAPLFELGPDGLAPTGRVDRGNSHLLQALTRPEESYAELRDRVERRAAFLGDLADRGTTAPEHVTAAYARYGESSC